MDFFGLTTTSLTSATSKYKRCLYDINTGMIFFAQTLDGKYHSTVDNIIIHEKLKMLINEVEEDYTYSADLYTFLKDI